MNILISRVSVFALLTLVACSSGSASAPGAGGSASADPSVIPDPPGPSGCKRGVIEADFKPLGPLAGAGVDPTSHELAPLPEGAVMSSTYLALRSGAATAKLFLSLFGAIDASLATQPGLLGYAFGTSASCGTARTLTVWKDEMSMVAFVTGPAHSAAVDEVSQISRGGTVVTSWPTTDPSEAAWPTAAEKLAAQEGASY